ncbi:MULTISPECIES: hypothetical protein [unclassified Amycolatopsis]|uniref:hypothetical protein n=1 Tax=unclassified Amycolatopsis TaxID=2618356 RepID=UPI001C699BA6|nr:hypothetical protein [Amycolatopsis sp. DSM 110486]QYN20939.1 hypothetical protein K1T34_52350 [Amycolatopsis sp. DSM 110486]
MKKLVTALAVLLLVSACGIQPTVVVPAGPAPTAVGPGARANQLTLYFLVDGQLAPVVRSWGSPVSPELAVNELFQGPSPVEQKSGYYSLLFPGDGQVTIDTSSVPPTVSIPFSIKPLYLGVDQVVCTTVAAMSAAGLPVDLRGVSVVTPDSRIGPTLCTF